MRKGVHVEQVPTPTPCNQPAWMMGIRLNDRSNPMKVVLQIPPTARLTPPDCKQLVLGHDLIGMAYEIGQDFKRTGRQRDEVAMPPNALLIPVDPTVRVNPLSSVGFFLTITNLRQLPPFC